MRTLRTTLATALGLSLVAAAPVYAGGGHGHHHPFPHDPPDTVSTVLGGLDGPRGLDQLGHGRTLISEADGTFSLVLERRHGDPRVIPLGSVPPGAVAPAVAGGPHGEVYVLTGGGAPGEPPGPGGATLYVWHWGDAAPTPVFDMAAYQQGDPDPYNLADDPGETNPFGLAPLRDGSVLVADAAGNDLVRVWPDSGQAVTVARLKPRMVTTPDWFTGPDLPPPGVPLDSEAVATSVTVGPDGYWYVGELRGFPATPGTSQIWRIRPGSVGAVCDPAQPEGKRSYGSRCTRYADGLTSIVDLGADRRSVYAVTLSKLSWLAVETDQPGAETGGLFRVSRGWHGESRVEELVPGQLVLPGGVDVDRDVYVTGPVFGPGALSRLE